MAGEGGISPSNTSYQRTPERRPRSFFSPHAVLHVSQGCRTQATRGAVVNAERRAWSYCGKPSKYLPKILMMLHWGIGCRSRWRRGKRWRKVPAACLVQNAVVQLVHDRLSHAGGAQHPSWSRSSPQLLEGRGIEEKNCHSCWSKRDERVDSSHAAHRATISVLGGLRRLVGRHPQVCTKYYVASPRRNWRTVERARVGELAGEGDRRPQERCFLPLGVPASVWGTHCVVAISLVSGSLQRRAPRDLPVAPLSIRTDKGSESGVVVVWVLSFSSLTVSRTGQLGRFSPDFGRFGRAGVHSGRRKRMWRAERVVRKTI